MNIVVAMVLLSVVCAIIGGTKLDREQSEAAREARTSAKGQNAALVASAQTAAAAAIAAAVAVRLAAATPVAQEAEPAR